MKKKTIGFLLSALAAFALFFAFTIQVNAEAFDRTLFQSHRPNLARVNETYRKLPLAFEANEGQTDSQVKFLSRGRGYTLFLTSTEAVLVLRGKTNEPPAVTQQSVTTAERVTKPHSLALKMQVVGCNPNSRITGLDKLPGKSNYFIGKDPKKWTGKISHFAKVRYEEVWPGVDLVYYGNQKQLEYDFIVAPGANPESITLAFEGADKIEIDGQGNVVLFTEFGKVVKHIPLVYQEIDGLRQIISGRYVLKGRNLIGFQLDAYDPGRKVVIDPVLSYSTYLGGTGNDYGGKGIALDSFGNVYITGYTSSTDFPTTAGTYQESSGGGDLDAYVTKINRTGSALLYSTYLGGGDRDYSYGIALDANGNVFLTGLTMSADFPTVNAYQTSYAGSGDIFGDVFVLKVNSEGTALLYSTYLGGQNSDAGVGIAVDPSGNVYVTGHTTSGDFPTTAGVLIPNSNAGAQVEAFVTKINPAKSGQESLVYSTYLTNPSFGLIGYSVYGRGIATDGSGNAYVTGSTDSWYFPTSPDAFQTKIGSASTYDAFVTKMCSDGTFFWYSTYLGGNGNDSGEGIVVDSAGNAYLVGSTWSTNFPLQNAYQDINRGAADAFITKLNQDGSSLIFSTYLGGENFDQSLSVAFDSAGSVYLTGETSSSDFPTVDPFQEAFGGGLADAFVSIVSPNGSTLLYSTFLGGSDRDNGIDIAVSPNGNAYVTGETASSDFPIVNAFQEVFGGINDAFVAKIARTSTKITAMPWLPLLLFDE